MFFFDKSQEQAAMRAEVDGDAPLRRMLYKEEEEPEAVEGLELGRRGLAEEIAVNRYMLRNLFQRAMEVEETGEYVRMVDLYGAGCVRLVQDAAGGEGGWG